MPILKIYMPDVKLSRSQPFSGAIADTSRQEGRLPCPLGSNKENSIFPLIQMFPVELLAEIFVFCVCTQPVPMDPEEWR